MNHSLPKTMRHITGIIYILIFIKTTVSLYEHTIANYKNSILGISREFICRDNKLYPVLKFYTSHYTTSTSHKYHPNHYISFSNHCRTRLPPHFILYLFPRLFSATCTHSPAYLSYNQNNLYY